MTSARTDAPEPRSCAALEAAILTVETGLETMGAALQRRDLAQVERCAGELHRALAAAVRMSAQAARRQELDPALRQRLTLATGQVAAQREVLARATAALDRAIDVLMPDSGTPAAAYGLPGTAEQDGPRCAAADS